MSYVPLKTEKKLEEITYNLKNNVDKITFFELILKAIEEFKKTDYNNEDVRNYFYNLAFETIFNINEDNSYVLEYIAYFKSNVSFYLERFEIVVNNLMQGKIHFDNAGETSVLDQEFWESNKAASVAENAQSEYVEEKPLFHEQAAASDDTMVLDPSFWENRKEEVDDYVQAGRQAYLIRVNNEEHINIDKPVYSIGKDKNVVDYVISENSVISRRHAEIITKGNHHFICDKCSTNKTYLDDKEISAEEVIEIFDGARIKLANEEFIFRY